MIRTQRNNLIMCFMAMCFLSCAAKNKETVMIQQETSEKITESASVQKPSKQNERPRYPKKKTLETPVKKNDTSEKLKADTSKKSREFTIVASKKTMDNSPLNVVKSYTEELKSLVELDSKKNREREQNIAEKVRQFFDFGELAKRSLGRHWSKRSQAQQKRYADTFISLIENSYLKRSQDLIGQYQVNFRDEEKKSNYAKVVSTVSRDDANIDISYELLKENDQWKIYNIILDDVNLIRNYRSQFNQLIKQKGFPHLMDLMKTRLAKMNSDDFKVDL